MSLRTIVALVTGLAVAFCAGIRVETQTSSGTQDGVAALLNEVRALRTGIETLASASARGQLTLGRLQLQEQRMHTAIARLEKVRERLTTAQREADDQQEHAVYLEAALKEAPIRVSESHPMHTMDRDDIEAMLKSQRREMALTAAEIQRLTAEEAIQTGEVTMEQSRWTELHRQLEVIEQGLARQPGCSGVSGGR
jgi:hypothetical protein